MTKAKLIPHVATETSTTKAAAVERVVGAVSSAIAEALAGDEPLAIAGFGKFAVRSRSARHEHSPHGSIVPRYAPWRFEDRHSRSDETL